MKRLTYMTVGDATHPQHYCHGPGIRKDDLLQRLGKLEDAAEAIGLIISNESSMESSWSAISRIAEVISKLNNGERR